MKKLKKKLLVVISIVAIISATAIGVYAASNIKLIVNGKNITSLSNPILENGRTLVPIRFIAEELGAQVEWDPVDRVVTIDSNNMNLRLKIDSRLVGHNNGTSYEISDVAPKIINDRTYVPLRLISNAMDVGIEWNEITKTVTVDQSKRSDKEAFYELNIISQNDGQTITGKTSLAVDGTSKYAGQATEIKYLLLDPLTSTGRIIGRGNKIDATYSYIPKLEDNGSKTLVAALYDKNNILIAADAVAVNVNIVPNIVLKGVSEGQEIKSGVNLSVDANFVPKYVKYEITNIDNGRVTTMDIQDPFGTSSWSPATTGVGYYSIRAKAYDLDNREYVSQPINVRTNIEPRLSLSGVSQGMTINKPVTLLASRNFDVSETEYFIKDVNTGAKTSLAKMPWGGYKWSPGPEFTGSKELTVRVKDPRGNYIESDPVKVYVDGSPRILFEGIGPKQVLAGPATVKISSNVALDSVSYLLTNAKTGNSRVLASGLAPTAEFTYTPVAADSGDQIIRAEGIYRGNKLSSENINFRVFLGKTYGPQPIIAKDKFVGFASNMAQNSWRKTGMSAALQTAQAILETGWGQSVPVDKYTGQLSNNLFGIKGQGPAGAVTSNTWEVYNGVTYRVDDEFRAYTDPEQSWSDHKEFLLNRDRYKPVTEVMHDYQQGAWALKRAGYATDPEYATKLMNIIKTNNLAELDKVGI